MLQLCKSVHSVHKSKNAIFLNNHRHLPYGRNSSINVHKWLGLWINMEQIFRNLILGNHYKRWSFMDYGQVLHYLSN